ncbi:MAG: cytidylate kinase family protein [Prevotellaceae bacterium]|nr:cytidylate kinase family protein [Prevotellaceae bacterium]
MAKIITLTGDLGSGKSTVSALLCARLGYNYIYTGSIQREIAARYRMTTLELNQYAETHPEIDEEIDSTFRLLGNSFDLVVDSRLAWYFIPNSFKVFMQTDLSVSAARIFADTKRKGEQKYKSTEEVAQHIAARKASENKRYADLYGVNCANLSQFDFVIDTSTISPEETANQIIGKYKAWLK